MSGLGACTKARWSVQAVLWACASLCLVAASSLAGAVTVTSQINASSDDAEESVNGGGVSTTSTDLEINYDGGEPQLVGMLFTGVTVPQGATICSNTYLQFQADESNSEVTSLIIYADDSDSAANLNNSNGNISGRAPTLAQVPWNNVPPWTTGNTYQSPSIQTVIQEIVDRGGWASNNQMLMIVRGGGGSRVAESHNGNAGAAPILHIEYDNGSGCGSPAIEVVQVNNNNDDAEENVTTTVIDRASSDLEFVHEAGTAQLVGLRFNNVSVPAGATITGATIRFTVDEADQDPTSTTIYGEQNAAPATFSGANNISGRSRTSASTAWNDIPAWNSVGASGADQTTPDLAAIVQEIIGLGGWSSGNSMAFILEGWGERTAESFDGSPGSAAVLTIDYVTAIPGEANIGVTKTDSVDPVPTNTTFNYTLTVSNNGPEDALGVTLVDNLPAALTFVSVFTTQGSCSESGGTVSCALGTIASGANATVTIFVRSPATSQSVSNSASISASTPDSLTADNSVTESTTIGGNTDQLCYIFSDGNNSLSLYDTALGTVTDYPPNGTVSIEAIAWDSANSILYGADRGQLGILSQVDGSWSPVGSGFGVATGSLGAVNLNDVDGMAFDPFAGANVLYGVHEVAAGADLLFQINTTTGGFVPGAFAGSDYVPIAVIAGNNITDDIAVDPLTGQMYAAVNNGGSTDRLVFVNKNTGATSDIALITIADVEGLGTDPSGQLWGSSGTRNTVFEIDKFTGVGSNERALTFTDYEAVDCTGVSPTVAADLEIVKTTSDAGPGPGDAFTYTLTLTNNGAANATGIQVYDLLPGGVTYASHTASQGIYDQSSGYWLVGSLNAGATVTLDINVTATSMLGTVITNTASVDASSQPDDDTSNNTSAVSITVEAPVITVSKSSNVTSGDPGTVIVYTVTVTNTGNSEATDVLMDDALGQFTEFGFHAYGDGVHFDFIDGGTPSGVTPGTPTFDDGTDTFSYAVPAGPTQVFDANVTDWRLPMVGDMNHSNASFTIRYQVRVQ